jgi:hypothetical protein
MHHIIYISATARDLTAEDLLALLEQSRRYNAARNITGVLLYGHRTVVQVLEGEQAVIEELYQRIARDERHLSVMKLADKPIQSRSFTDWSMGYERLGPEQARHLQGYFNPSDLDVDALSLTEADSLLVQSVQDVVLGRRRA